MLDIIQNLVREHASQAIDYNTNIPTEQNEQAVEATSSGIMEALKSQMQQGGGMESILSMLSGGGTQVGGGDMAGIVQQVAGSVASKLGISEEVAQSMAASLVPMVLTHLGQRAGDPTDTSVTPESILSSLTGSSGGGGLGNIASTLGALFK
jgi:hypothetical protein